MDFLKKMYFYTVKCSAKDNFITLIMQFIDRFLGYIKDNKLFSSSEPMLLAVSGGKDSVMMTHLFAEAGLNFAIAHCNFGLRSQASDLDQDFVEELANQLQVKFFSRRFDTEEYASRKRISIQMAARDLRYEWLEDVRRDNIYSYVAVAHHQTDSVETTLLNLLRGTGIGGLYGIAAKRDRIIRPLLAFTGLEIETEILRRGIAFREDTSNSSTKYKRNLIRLEVLPVLRKINLNIEKTFEANARRFAAVESFFQKSVEAVRPDLFLETVDGEFWITLARLQQLDPVELWLYELFKPYGFTEAVLSDLQREWNNGSGKQFFSRTHQLVVDRKELILRPIETPHNEQITITRLPYEYSWFGKRFRVYQADNEEASKERIYKGLSQVIDYDRIEWPLTVRAWQEGDRFKPLGMGGSKKISDFLISLKIPLSEKHHIPIVVDSNKTVVAVLPWRIGDPFKITPKTKKVIIFEELKHEKSTVY